MIQEHLPLITGKGSYIDGISPKNVVYLSVVRSPIARGIIKNISKPNLGQISLMGSKFI
ncbi:xanthine dehydrogenase family protein molybdopterin-binding subunit [Saccharolobus islandicus]|uniref:Carbon monoxide dehydrogenase, large chain (CutA-1) n=2 Tax=Saccharolobus islandicus TaxID=43080 RepID=C3MUM1_SACI4|nr:carbon monoxide dehydrogenase [Sulfolobus islandicus]ACP37255.1 carbon monoxide dehydrogenase, large chain (CutA-1) [Sulfolobus islandicus M.14.25]ACP54400.1 carbon monoxide dehydrogenase, large chain (CutA-1) [Sulfolobus islandicus M.16.27]